MEKEGTPITHSKNICNTVVAAILFFCSLAIAITDLRYSGDLLFSPTGALFIMLLVILLWTTAALITTVFPKRFVFSIALLFMARSSIGFPVNAFIENNSACLLFDGLLVLTTLFYLVFAINLRVTKIVRRPWLSWKHSIIVIVVNLIMGGALIPMFVGGMINGLHNVVGDYVRLSMSSVSMVERVFEKDGVKVFLVGMMHIGEPEFYDQLNERMAAPIEGKRAILLEAVSDESNILPADFKSGQTYGALAKQLGLQVQGLGKQNADSFAGIGGWTKGDTEYIHADIDVSELSQKHQTLLVEVLRMISDGGLFATTPPNFTNRDLEGLMMDGLLKFRNDRLIQTFHKVIEREEFEEVYIPWGAAHLGDIEERIKQLGYEEIHETVQPVFRFWSRG